MTYGEGAIIDAILCDISFIILYNEFMGIYSS